ncbi:DUF1284 domain-containing protein [Paenibacillus sp. TRM 82003]|nr:DUF1284 domain-containing protein [Paenibacillus sp. TRM 82003]
MKLRGHHLLCLLGFRGMGYSPAFTRNMTAVYERLRAEPSSIVTIVRGTDDLCVCFPADQPNHCESDGVHRKDDLALAQLGLKHGQQIAWSDVLAAVRMSFPPSDIRTLCATCPWEPYGVCEAGVARIAAGDGLAPLPES